MVISNILQFIPDAAVTHTTTAIVFTMLASCSVLTDPLVYIIRHKKYRRRMLSMLNIKSYQDPKKYNTRFSSIDTDSIHSSRKTSVIQSRKISTVSAKSNTNFIR